MSRQSRRDRFYQERRAARRSEQFWRLWRAANRGTLNQLSVDLLVYGRSRHVVDDSGNIVRIDPLSEVKP